MRRKDRERDKAFALSVIDKCEYATLATVSDGLPYCVPVSVVRRGTSIYFHCAKCGKKVEAMRAFQKVCVTAVGDTKIIPEEFTTLYESAVVVGTAHEITDEAQKIEALRLLCMKYTPGSMDAFDAAITKSLHRTAIWEVQIEEITGKCKQAKTENET